VVNARPLPRPHYPRKVTGTHCTGQVLVQDWMGPENFVLTGVRTVIAYYLGICLDRLGISNCQDNMCLIAKYRMHMNINFILNPECIYRNTYLTYYYLHRVFHRE